MFWYVLLALLMLGVMIMVHEAGHYLAARACGIAVKEFSLGFGPKLIHWKGKKSGTEFSIRPIPLGGFCMFYGDTDDDPDLKKQDDPRCYNNFAPWKRLISVIAGPLMNFVLAALVAVVLLSAYGGAAVAPVIASVNPASPAEEAGLMPGDVLLSVNGVDMSEQNAQGAVDATNLAADGEPVLLTISRNGVTMEASVMPVYDEGEGRRLMGVTISTQTRPLHFGEVLSSTGELCANASVAIIKGIGQLFTDPDALNQTSGPVGVVALVAEQTQQYGLSQYLYLIVVLSINLGLMNLLPIPGLDGSRVVFLLIEWIARKPVPRKVEAIIHLCGYALLILFVLFITGKDVLNLFK